MAITSIGDFTTIAGATVTGAEISYRRHGEFRGNAYDNNVILVEHALTGDTDVTEWWPGLIGPGLALDTDRFCVICTNALGGCGGSTGPSSVHPDGRAWGSRFPALSIRDLVEAERRLLEQLGIYHVHAVIGGSMGGARALEWTLMYPTFVDAACIIAVSARASGWQIGIQTAQISAITRDPDWHGGDYYDICDGPREGLSAARRIAHLTYRGEMEIDERFGTIAQQGENPLGAFRRPDQRFAVNSYLDYQGRKLVERFDAGSYVTLTEALNRHDVGRGRSGLNKALYSSTVPTMLVGVDTDILYPFHQQEHLSRNIGQLMGLRKLVSPVGHDAFLTETRQMDRILRMFINKANDGAEPTDGFGHDPEGVWNI
ncbi:homoserine O-acetyltransferase [Corynebacterium yudongzhengii]|uniref:Homoserine O-acetyltransferase n=1 Tax=Corynebacterium yudongzhengii TaxID=2080740 RepID=A0A2U1T767_9CORY|nr:homoserine O-acetyltransferase [Corynebacterium yudongzhengii]PWC01846.1 homoserine O-acetyltransferase [Corynebacterium yudongzhengii]